MTSKLFFYNSLSRSIFFSRMGAWLVFIITMLYYRKVFLCNAIGVTNDKTPGSAASNMDYPVCKCPFYVTLGIKGVKNES